MEAVQFVSQERREAQATERRQSFIERMERKLARKTALQRQRRRLFRARLVRRPRWQ